MEPLLRRSFAAHDLMRAHPPRITDRNKRIVFDLAMAGAPPAGTIEVTRWPAAPLPDATPAAVDEQVQRGYYDYAAPGPGVWHVNFADPVLFVAYGAGLLAQDELQCAEHPALGAIREALGADARTEVDHRPTPILIRGVERRCTLETARSGLYGNAFARASAEAIAAAVTRHDPPARSNLIAIAAPVGAGPYTRAQLASILVTAYTGFRAAVTEAAGATEIRTGFWGCGAFGGNRQVMAALQLLAARLAGAATVTFYAFDDAGRADWERARDALARLAAPTVDETLDRFAAAGYRWGVSNGT